MKIIKLDAIDSTNDFLKLLADQEAVESFTVVTAQHQKRGKGQRGAKWHSEKGKNLTMSLLLKDVLCSVDTIYILNIIVAMSITAVLEDYNIPALSIKWPNDIMSANKKLGGILIENTFKNTGAIVSIVGIGLNVNQLNFDGLPKASSLAAIMNTEFDIEALLIKIAKNIECYTKELITTPSTELWLRYNDKLFRKSIPTVFENRKGEKFMGIIKEVNQAGKLQVLLEDGSTASFEIKEIKMLY
ncbi:MAG TPA: biotin--[acetyl-CoA-carboxylase] ligase [Flavobacterium sp.]|jgi:BirA family biotin operon repressor/biotin-[acetyl-CoA-carboxylase] ligase